MYTKEYVAVPDQMLADTGTLPKPKPSKKS
jgi:hypothetical protein